MCVMMTRMSEPPKFTSRHRAVRTWSPAERREALLVAAERVFLAKGYHAATMNDVARAARISKKTVYETIASKEELFAALIAWRQEQLVIPEAAPGATVPERLTALLLTLARFLLAPAQVGLIRLIMTEYTHSPDFGRYFLRKHLAKARARMENALLGLAMEHGLSRPEAREQVAMLFGMAIGEFHFNAVVGFRASPSKAALEGRVRLAVGIFLAGCCPEKFSHLSPTCGVRPPDA